MAKGWHIVEEEGALTLCRHLPPRFDFMVETCLPTVRPLRLAHQVRQDMWRALRQVRGFSPVVRIAPTPDGGVRISAGGRVSGRLPERLRASAQAVLDSPRNQARWLRHAGRSS